MENLPTNQRAGFGARRWLLSKLTRECIHGSGGKLLCCVAECQFEALQTTACIGLDCGKNVKLWFTRQGKNASRRLIKHTTSSNSIRYDRTFIQSARTFRCSREKNSVTNLWISTYSYTTLSNPLVDLGIFSVRIGSKWFFCTLSIWMSLREVYFSKMPVDTKPKIHEGSGRKVNISSHLLIFISRFCKGFCKGDFIEALTILSVILICLFYILQIFILNSDAHSHHVLLRIIFQHVIFYCNLLVKV